MSDLVESDADGVECFDSFDEFVDSLADDDWVVLEVIGICFSWIKELGIIVHDSERRVLGMW